jgi:hypothetical protein
VGGSLKQRTLAGDRKKLPFLKMLIYHASSVFGVFVPFKYNFPEKKA